MRVQVAENVYRAARDVLADLERYHPIGALERKRRQCQVDETNQAVGVLFHVAGAVVAAPAREGGSGACKLTQGVIVLADSTPRSTMAGRPFIRREAGGQDGLEVMAAAAAEEDDGEVEEVVVGLAEMAEANGRYEALDLLIGSPMMAASSATVKISASTWDPGKRYDDAELAVVVLP